MVKLSRFAWDDPRGPDLEQPPGLFDELDGPLPELAEDRPLPHNVEDVCPDVADAGSQARKRNPQNTDL